MHAGLGQLQGNFLVEDCRHGGDSHVDALLNELLDGIANLQPTGNVVGVSKGVSDGDKVNTLKLADNACVVTAHHAQPNKASAQICH
ncbi:hypothetical protein NtRootA4_23780 [Arthrobacter sp. NtRootA4]|nr:hypothetical protein NtRootA2_25970 [Arthrobacter sp. NtRootA2]BCW15399.1 hypothetical protein NtRootA4_23780 [Arthrobacter sp. NtRootA4]BCW23734.1 hypothetical protein NtRootC7_26010 [Arthrobacter sp. NtRootC7]BCW28001.1 hypothetical protein NtRootC45_26010 [Arthrobacter sp. NtRootC45]BCW32271.1 hypothetical protein NtRootD5_26020 [Arthrobacter sp. NtRootD5]